MKLAALLLAVLAIGLAGCGSSDDEAAARSYCADKYGTDRYDTSWKFANCIVSAKETARRYRDEGREDELPPEFQP